MLEARAPAHMVSVTPGAPGAFARDLLSAVGGDGVQQLGEQHDEHYSSTHICYLYCNIHLRESRAF